MIDVSIIIPFFNAGKTIEKTLASVMAQKDFVMEVIMVDDGSEDESFQIAERWANEDSRIVLVQNEHNMGVSASRNRALKLVRGRYIRFVDADDIIPPDSTKQMLEVADRYDSDLVMGIMRKLGSIDNVNYTATVELAEKTFIDKYDLSLVHSFTNANKMFRASIISDHDIEFRNFKHSEDGMFLYEFLQYAEMINGCNTLVYYYYRPEYNEAETTTVNVNMEMLQGILEISDRIAEIHKDAPPEFHEELNVRILDQSLINHYYKKMWRLNDADVVFLKQKMEEYRDRISDESWQKICRNKVDLALGEGIFDHGQIAENALFTIVIGEKLSADQITATLRSLYYQLTPLFLVILDESAREAVPEEFMKHQNLRFMKGEGYLFDRALQAAGARYIAFIEEPVQFSMYTLRKAAGKLNNDISFVSGICKRMRKGRGRTPDHFRYICSKGFREMDSAGCLADRLDYLLSDKIFKTEPLKAADVRFADGSTAAVKKLCNKLTHDAFSSIQYLLDYSNRKYLNTIMKGNSRKALLHDLKITGRKSSDALTNAAPGHNDGHEEVLYEKNKKKMKRHFRKLYQDLSLSKAVYEKKAHPDIADRMRIYNQYRFILFETYDREFDAACFQSEHEAFPLMDFLAESPGMREMIISYLAEESQKPGNDTESQGLLQRIKSAFRR